MIGQLETGLTWAVVLGSGVIAGVFFAFSTFIMKAFSRLEEGEGIAAMQSINTAILRSLFMPVFFGTAIICLVLGVFAMRDLGGAGGVAMLVGALAYVFGVVGCTIALNVPLNDRLASVTIGSAEAGETWRRYLRTWTLWNHVRTVASMVACLAFIIAASHQ